MIERPVKSSARLVMLFAVLGSSSQAQNVPLQVQQTAKRSSCSNILALAGNVNIKCSSLTPSQQRLLNNIPALLNKVLANQLDPDAVMAKLDEIAKSQARTATINNAPGGIAMSGGTLINPRVNNFAPIPRRLSPEDRSALLACLAQHPGHVRIGYLSGDAEAFSFASDWLEVFQKAKWSIENDEVYSFMPMIPFTGTALLFHGLASSSGEASYDKQSIEGQTIGCILDKKIAIDGVLVPRPEEGSGYLTVKVGSR